MEIPEEILRRANLSVGDPVEWSWTSTGGLSLRAPESADESAMEEGYEEWKRQEIEAGLAAIEEGRSVAGEKVFDWLRSWGTEHELPPPL